MMSGRLAVGHSPPGPGRLAVGVNAKAAAESRFALGLGASLQHGTELHVQGQNRIGGKVDATDRRPLHQDRPPESSVRARPVGPAG